MRIHTDGEEVVLRGPHGLIRWRKGDEPTVSDLADEGPYAETPRGSILVLSPSGERDFTPALESLGVLDAVALDDTRVAALIKNDEHAALVIGEPPDSASTGWDRHIDLQAFDAVELEWPPGLIWDSEIATDELFSEARQHGTGIKATADAVPTLSVSPWGFAIASRSTGVVCVVRPDSTQVAFAVRLPSRDQATIHAEASERGVMITMAIAGRESALLHLSDSGELLGHRASHGAPPAVLLETGVVLYDQKREWLFLLDEVLKLVTKKRVPFVPLDSAAAANRKSFALADDGAFLVGTVNDKLKLELGAPFAYASFIKKSKRKAKAAIARAVWDPRRPGGPASVGFSAARPVAPWEAEAGKEFTMELSARSGGGQGRGIVVAVAGDALASAEFEAVVFDGQRIPFEKQADGSYRAEVPDVVLVEAIRYPFDPKPKNDPQKETAKRMLDETHFELKLIGRAKKASGDLLTVFIGPLETEKPPLKWMRPLIIR